MSPELQQFLALSIVAIAASVVIWRLASALFRGQRSSGCATGCGQCPANQAPAKTPEGQPLVQIQLRAKP